MTNQSKKWHARVRLLECCDFQATCIGPDRYLGRPERLIDKKYYVIEAGRIVATTRIDHLVFKGGTTEEFDLPGRMAAGPAIGGI